MSAHLRYHTLLRGSKNTGLRIEGCYGLGIFLKAHSACTVDIEAILAVFAVLDADAESVHEFAHRLALVTFCRLIPLVLRV
jgi:hypothetical protein